MSSASQTEKKQTVARQLLTRALALWLAVVLLLMVAAVTVQYHIVKREVAGELRLIHQSFGPGVAQALWDINTDQVRSFYEGMRDLPTVVGAEIKDESGETICSGGLLLDESGKPVFVDPSGERSTVDAHTDVFSYSSPIRFGRDEDALEVGEAVIYSSSEVVLDRMLLGIGLTLVQIVLATVVLGVIFLLLFRRYLGRPLGILSSAVEKVDLNQIDGFRVDVGATGRNELKVLEESFNRMAEGLARDRRDLGERMKEIGCLYGISQLTSKADITMEELFHKSVHLLPPGWQYPEITCARLRLGDQTFVSEGFEETQWRQSSDITVSHDTVGQVEIFHRKEMPELDEGPFLTEERNLIEAIADRLGSAILGHRAAADLQKHQQQLEDQVEERTQELQNVLSKSEATAAEESSLGALASSLQGRLSTEEVAERSLSAFVDHIQAPSGTLYVLEDDGKLHRRASHALPAQAESLSTLPVGSGSIGQAAKSGKMSTFSPSNGKWSLSFGAAQIEPKQVVTVPLLASDAVTGVLELCLLSELEESQSRWVTKGADISAAALRFARERHEREEAQRAIAEANERLEARIPIALLGSEIGEVLIGDAPLRERLQMSAEAFVKHVDATFVRIWTVNDAGDMLDLQASAGLYTHIDGKRAHVTIGKRKIGLIAAEGTPYVNDGDVQHDPRLDEPEWAKEQGLTSFFGYPMEVQGRIVGVLGMFFRERLNKDLLEAVPSIGTGIAVTIERERAQAEVRKLSLATEQSPATVVITDKEGTIEYVNPKFTQVTGYTADEAIGQNPKVLNSGVHSREFFKDLWETVLGGSTLRAR